MEKTIIEIIKKELSAYEANLNLFKGGMDNYKESLEDSDTFYNEASTIGAITALNTLISTLENLDFDVEYVKNFFAKNCEFIAKDLDVVRDYLCVEVYPDYAYIVEDTPGQREYIESVSFKYRDQSYVFNIHDLNKLILFKTTSDTFEKLLDIEIPKRFSTIKVNEQEYILNISPNLLEEYKDEVISAIENSDGNSAEINIEADRYGYVLKNLKVKYAWEVKIQKEFNIDSNLFLVSSVGKYCLESIYKDIYESDIRNLDAFLKYAAGCGVFIQKVEYKKLGGYGYVKLVNNDVYIAEDIMGTNSKKLEYLPENSQMHYLNLLCETLNAPLKFSDFKNDNSKNDRKQIIRLLEDKTDEDGSSYIISNLIANWQIKHMFKMASFVWNEYSYDKALEDVSKSFYKEFGIDLEEISVSSCPDSWYEIFENVMTHMNVDFERLDSKTFII